MFTKTFKNYLPLILIILLASFLRFWMLGHVPISMSDDEIRETYVSYSLAHTGRDYYGNFLPIVFKMDGFSTYGLVPIYLRSIFFLVLDLNPFAARLPYALSSLASLVLFYFIVKKLFDNKIALFSSFVLSLSVWNIQLARFAIETNIALFLYLLGIYVFLYSKDKTRLIVISMIILFMAFYSYVAFKVFFLPLMLILLWYKFKELNKKQIFIILATIFLSLASYAVLSITTTATSYAGVGGNAFFFQDKAQTALSVELERRASTEPNFIKTIYYNKFTYWARVFSTNYLTAFSPQYLFLNQEASGIYSIWGRGEMYVFELPFLLIGLFYLSFKKRKEFYLVLLLLLISPLPSAIGIGTPTWFSRSAFMIFWLSLFVGAGIYYLITVFKKRNYRYLVIIFIFLTYSYALVGYVYQYYYDWSRTNAKYFSKSTQDLVYKINDFRSRNKEVFVSGATQITFLNYAFYDKIDPKIIQANINKYPIKFSNFIFQKDCLTQIPKNIIYITSVDCKYMVAPSSVIKAYDSGEVIWNIYIK